MESVLGVSAQFITDIYDQLLLLVLRQGQIEAKYIKYL